MSMRDEDVVRSLLNWFASNYADDVDFGSADDFDPEADDLSTFVEYYPETLKKPPTRRGSAQKKECKVMLTFRCWARGGEDILAAQKLASAIVELIDSTGNYIEVKNFDTSDEAVVGAVTLFEPQPHDKTSELNEKGWQLVDVMVEGRAEEA